MQITEQDRQKIESAVKAAEEKTSGEIVPLVVQRSSDYDSLGPRGTIIGLSIGGLIGIFWLILQIPGSDSFDTLSLNLESLLGLVVPTVLMGGIIKYIALKNPKLIRVLIPSATIDEALRSRACRAFLEHEVFNTRDRTGILIMVSLDEHRVTVLADSGINQKVDNSTWDECVELVLTGIQKDDFGGGMADAITHCGDIVTNAGFTIRNDDTNELSDSLKVEA